ncbi:hypothetical protein, partial [Staphylococcus auricularis]
RTNKIGTTIHKKEVRAMEEERVNLKRLIESENEDLRIPTLFIKLQSFLYKNNVSVEERKVLARMFHAYYED